MAGHQLIDEYVAELGHRLPADAVDELADGLFETWQRHLTGGSAPDAAARAAIVEFGTPGQITAAFVAQAPGRRTALTLLATGPIVGMCWGTSLIAARAWTWSVPWPVVAMFGLTLLTVVAALVTAVASRHSYRLTRLGSGGGLVLVLLDLAMLVAVALLAPALVWPMAAAIPASLLRIGLTIKALPRFLA